MQHTSLPFKIISLSAVVIITLLSVACAGKKTAPIEVEPEVVERSEPVEQVQEQPKAQAMKPIAVRLRNNAPARYVVKKGDTLWDISKMYLNEPWLWPEVWYFNPQIANPHLIYPGDVLVMSYINGRPQIRLDNGKGGGVVESNYTTAQGQRVKKLSPRIYRQSIESAIPTIPIDAIRPFLKSARILAEDDFKDLPVVIGTLDDRMMADPNTLVYVKGLKDNGAANYDVIRKGRVFKHHETGKVLGVEAIQLAKSKLVKRPNENGLATFRLQNNDREVLKYDLLARLDSNDIDANMVPSAPQNKVEGSIVALHNAIAKVGTNQVVIIDLGKRDGMKVGNILSIDQRGQLVRGRIPGTSRSELIRLPKVYAGLGLVFRVFDDVSYVLIVESTRSVKVGDTVRNPEPSKDF